MTGNLMEHAEGYVEGWMLRGSNKPLPDLLHDFALEQLSKQRLDIAIRLENECSRNAHLDAADCIFCQIAAELRQENSNDSR